ncbi:hypothetical protein NLU13_4261 [Sarocladium strictum]|uniref:Zn(2)-C6 fungal-type domain-containing protein n=1 Tax=Sarocladium strictum TaxID=5046 RepID=A0AA39GL42_SARSR|nr:hypothetical protein NLU13_4261 [Sarocladium strictum]
MIAPPHPTQVRSACERCRRQKLKCSRQQGVASSEPCARCTRLGFFCEAGSQRKIGRPGKSATAASTAAPVQAPGQMPTPNPPTAAASSVPSPIEVFSSEESSPNVLSATVEAGAETAPFMGPLDQDPAWQQVFGDGLLNASGIMSLTLPQQPQLLAPEDFVVSSRPFARPSDESFEALSKINSTLHTISQSLRESWPIESMCDRPSTEGLPDLVIFQLTIQCSQEFLTTLKTIHRAVGINKPAFPPNIRTSPSGNWRPSFNDENNAFAQPKLDLATTFLIVSCFVQLVELCENLLNMFEMFMRYTLGETLRNDGMTFADVTIPDFTTQVSMFAEMVRHVLLQINVVIGVPGTRRLNTVWYGLLTDPKGQEILRRELGSSMQEWSERPKKLITGIDRLKALIEEASMLAQF